MKIKKIYQMPIAIILVCILFSNPTLAGELTELEIQREVTQEEVNQLQEELNTLLADLDTMETQLISIGEQIIQSEKDLERAEEDKQQQFDDMMLRIVYIYEARSDSVLEIFLSAGSIAELLIQVEMVQTIHNHDRAMLAVFNETVEIIEELKASLEEDFASLEYKQEAYKEQVENVREIIETRSAELGNIDEMIEEAIRFAAALAAEAEAQAAREAEAARELENDNDSNEIAEIPPDSQPEQPPTPPVEDPPVEDSPVEDSPPEPPPSVEPPPLGGDATAAQIIVAAAHSAIGVPYVWGGSTTAGFDCSGLTMWAHAQAGIHIPRTSITQRNAGRPVPMGQQQPGDIAWTVGHVGLYIGNGLMIEAQRTGTNVMISPVRVNVFVRFW